MRLVLASASPRRRELLRDAGFACDVVEAAIDETLHANERPAESVDRLARDKVAAVARDYPDRPVIGGDTIVAVDGVVLGKPADAADAARMLRALSGRSHQVFTGVALAWHGEVTSAVEQTRVWFEPLSDADIAWYVGTGEPRGKAGAYAIQGVASRYVQKIAGSYTNVIGLPIEAVVRLLNARHLSRSLD